MYTKDKQIAHELDRPPSQVSIWPPCTCRKPIPGNPRISLACRLCLEQGANLSVPMGSKVPLGRLAKTLEVGSGLSKVSF